MLFGNLNVVGSYYFISKRGYIIQFLELYAKINAAFWLIFGLLLVHTALFDKSIVLLMFLFTTSAFYFLYFYNTSIKKTTFFLKYIVLTTIFICYYFNNQPIIWILPLTLSHPFASCFLINLDSLLLATEKFDTINWFSFFCLCKIRIFFSFLYALQIIRWQCFISRIKSLIRCLSI